MRTLTLKRKWSLVECAAKINFFVQCSEEEATEEFYFIPCKLVCRTKNGKTITMPITEEATTIFMVTALTVSPYEIPAGSEDVSLLATPKLDYSHGNPFVFTRL